MNETTQPATSESDRPVADLVKDLSELVPRLIRDELKLAQVELSRKGKEAGVGAGLFGGSGLIALYGIGCVIAAVIIAISGAIAAWLAALIVGIALLAVAGIAAQLGRKRLRRATPPVPKETMGSVQADVREIREAAHR